MKKQSGRNVGTLAYIKSLIQRANVNGNVKSRFKAHEDFTILVGRAILCHFFLEHFGMESTDDNPTKMQSASLLILHRLKRKKGKKYSMKLCKMY